jgi:hypothetical protein
MRRRSDDVLHLCGLPVLELRDDMVKFCSLIADASEWELSLSLSEPHGWPLGPERWEPHSNSGCLCCVAAVCRVHVLSGSPMWWLSHSQQRSSLALYWDCRPVPFTCTVVLITALYRLLHCSVHHRILSFISTLVLISALYRSFALQCWSPHCIVHLHCSVEHRTVRSSHALECWSAHCIVHLHCSADHRTVPFTFTVVLITALTCPALGVCVGPKKGRLCAECCGRAVFSW